MFSIYNRAIKEACEKNKYKYSPIAILKEDLVKVSIKSKASNVICGNYNTIGPTAILTFLQEKQSNNILFFPVLNPSGLTIDKRYVKIYNLHIPENISLFVNITEDVGVSYIRYNKKSYIIPRIFYYHRYYLKSQPKLSIIKESAFELDESILRRKIPYINIHLNSTLNDTDKALFLVDCFKRIF